MLAFIGKLRVDVFQSLRYRDFRYLWAGTLLGATGQWIQIATLSWIIYDMTGSGTLLGLLNGMRFFAFFLFTPYAGIAADRMNRRTLMLMTQLATFVLALALGGGLYFDVVGVSHLMAFSFLAGAAQVLNQPVRQTVVFDLVPRESVPNAVALNTVAFNGTRIVTPGLAGYLIAFVGAAGNLFIQAAAYLGAAISVLFIRFPLRPQAQSRRSLFQNLRESLAYIKNDPLARTLIMMGFVPTFLILPIFAALMPIYAKDILRSGASGLGLLLSAIGLGALIGALFAGSLGNFQRRGLMQLAALAAMCLSVIAFALAHNLYVALALLAIAGFCEEVFLVTNQALLQLSVPDQLRGRVTSFFLLNTGLQPLGAFFAGVLADALGAPVTTILMAAMAGALGVAIAIAVPRVRDLRLSEILPAADGTRTAR